MEEAPAPAAPHASRGDVTAGDCERAHVVVNELPEALKELPFDLFLSYVREYPAGPKGTTEVIQRLRDRLARELAPDRDDNHVDLAALVGAVRRRRPRAPLCL